MAIGKEMPEEVKTGTTTVAVALKDSVVMGAERRATMGYLIAHKATKKVFKIDDNLGMTIAGLVGDAQILVRYLRAEVELYRLKRGLPITVLGASSLLANILHGSRYYPYWVGLILGGLDSKGGQVFSLDAAGGSIPDDYVSVGSGSPFAYGVLEDGHSKDIRKEDAINLVMRALRAAQQRDAASGNGYTIAIIDKDGYSELGEDDVEKRLKKISK